MDTIKNNVYAVANEAKIKLEDGRIIVDDLTYDSLKKYPNLYPITYLNWDSLLTGKNSLEVIDILKPNYAIVRCEYLSYWKDLSEQFHKSNICAINFKNGFHAK